MAPGSNRKSGLLDLTGQLYDAGLDDTLWPQTATKISQQFDSTSTAVHLRDSNPSHALAWDDRQLRREVYC